MKRVTLWMLVGTMVVFGASLIAVADVTETSTVTATALSILRLSVDDTTVEFGDLGEADYDLGYKEVASAQGLTIKTNRAWVLNVKANAAVFSYVGDSDPSKPSTDLEWKASSSHKKVTATQADYVGLTTSDAQVAAGNRGRNITVGTSFEILLDYEDDPAGDYSLVLTYTLTVP